MINSPLVSIVTPTLNSEKYISKTMESINGQTYNNIEHIVVDGCSKDQTIEIINNFGKSKLLTTKIPGMYSAINIGLKKCKGEIICYLNSDDIFSNELVIEKVVAHFNKYHGRNWLYGNCEFIDENSLHIKYSIAPPFIYNLFSAVPGMYIFQPATFWRRNIHDKYGYFSDEFKLAADFDFFLRIGKEETPIRIGGSPLAKFRVHNKGLSSKYKSIDRNEVRQIKINHGINNSLIKTLFSKALIKIYNIHKIFKIH